LRAEVVTAVDAWAEMASLGAADRLAERTTDRLQGLDAEQRSLTAGAARRMLLTGLVTVLTVAGVLLAMFTQSRTPDTPELVLMALLTAGVLGNADQLAAAGDARRDAQRLITGAIIGVALGALLPGPMRLPPQFLAVFGLVSIAALIVERRIVDLIVHEAYVRGYGLRRALIITRGYELEEVMAAIVPYQGNGRPAEDQVIVGYVTPDRYDDAALGDLNDLEQVLDSKDVSELLIATTLPPEAISEMAEVCFERGVRVLVIPSVLRAVRRTGWADLTQIGRSPAYHLHPARLELPALILKRATDLLLATLGLIVGLPLMLLIAIGIKLESRGPVFFRQRRVGLGGREFMMWKFRSMLHEAELQQDDMAHLNEYCDGRLFKLQGDPRVTRIGRLLRRFSLDELPQLFNVIAGQMSLVGPRPPLPREVRHYEEHHFVRLSVVPGLTGPWQVNGRNLITDFEEIVQLERSYIESWSLRSDLEIMLRTLAVVLEGKGAY
jgi:exopolysaccharide biosynthesis polyprenyl glycosylphosphotransferase